MKITLKELNERFIYKSDKDNYGVTEHWVKGETSGNDKMYMDCEDYALTIKSKVISDEYDFSKWDLYWCRLDGEGHCALSNGYLVIDNNIKKVITLDKYFQIFKITEFRKFTYFELFGKYIVTYLFNPIIRLIKQVTHLKGK